MNPIEMPLEIRVNPERDALAVRWRDGHAGRLEARDLRAACRCAACVAAQHRNVPYRADAGTRIVAVNAIGTYAINISFSDGHDRGIFPWSYLRDLESAA